MLERLNEQVERGYVLLQAGVAEGALGEIPAAYRRAQDLAQLDNAALATLARVASDFVCRLGLASGADWTTSTDASGNSANLEGRSPQQRVFTRRMMAAWSSGDTDSFDALLSAACTEHPQRRRSYLEGLFQLAIDEADMHGQRMARPFTVVGQLTHSILEVGLKTADGNA
ncbi:hypothetical protein ACFC0M_20070 [Streptomyces sp. NPDC056149]|uniref:hypothetical protein n=1 Tax=Streptomyces sp. NPDC056149 TaxID=3345728 RepID=UPI0035D55840